jgi:hypothetical protein
LEVIGRRDHLAGDPVQGDALLGDVDRLAVLEGGGRLDSRVWE